MTERSLITFLAALLYAVWLVAGLVDYFCHRRTNIETTSGASESWLHLVQFLLLGLALLLGTLLAVTPLVLVLIVVIVCTHSVVALWDVSYTQGRRFISPLEQHVHGYMEVLPVVAVGLLAILNWDDITASPWTLQWKPRPLAATGTLALLASFCVIAGIPIVEELLRTSRSEARRRAVTSASRPA
jgi:hypothetical protein